MKHFIGFLLFFCTSQIFSQSITRYVLDKQTNLSIPYTTVKVLHTSKGAIASSKGEFNIEIQKLDSVLFTSVGYQQKIVVGYSIGNNVYLEPKIKILDSVLITTKKKVRTLLLGYQNIKKADVNWGPSGQLKEEFAQRIELPDSTVVYKLQKVFIPVNKFGCFGPLLLHIYEADTSIEKIGKELFTKAYSVTKRDFKNGSLQIDVSRENLYLPMSNSFFVSVGWLENAQKEDCITVIRFSKSSKAETYKRSLADINFAWSSFTSKIPINGSHIIFATYYWAEVDEMK
jgi:hypothetical protein